MYLATCTCSECEQFTPTATMWGEWHTAATASEKTSPWQVWRPSWEGRQEERVGRGEGRGRSEERGKGEGRGREGGEKGVVKREERERKGGKRKITISNQ